MFEIALLIGLYSYIVFFLGVFGLLYQLNIVLVTFSYLLAIAIFYYKKVNLRFNLRKLDNLSKIIIGLLFFQFLVNLAGVLGPEISFDALWYHLTLPKIFLAAHSIFHIPGNLLYYSDMPKLTEMFYIGGLSLGNEIAAKLIHFSFGILTLFAIYKISVKFVSQRLALLAALIFYSNLVVGWESITAYVDLSRTFFEVMAFWGFMNWTENKTKRKWLVISGFMMGLAISTKLISALSIFIYVFIFLYLLYLNKEKIGKLFINLSTFILPSIIIPLPWFIFSFINTGNSFYPYFSGIPVDSGNIISLPNIQNFLRDFYALFLNLNDPISPVYLIILPVIFVFYRSFNAKAKLIALYVFASLAIWYVTQEQRGGRFILSYLPVFSIFCVILLDKLKYVMLKKYLIFIIIAVSVVSIGYRGLANSKFLPVILGQETKSQFLSAHLNFSFGDFYDTDGYFQKHIKARDKVLLYGFHNLYYVDFPFIDSSWIKKGDKFNYISVQDTQLPAVFSNWKEIYYNKLTKVGLYSNGGKQWIY